MSSLKNRYAQLTDTTNQGIFDNEEWLLAIGRIYQGSELRIPFASSAVVDFILEPGQFPVGANLIQFNSDSIEYEIDLYALPTYTGGTEISLTNQNIGSSNVAGFKLLKDATVTDVGILGTSFLIRGQDGGIFTSSSPTGATDVNKRIVQPGYPLLIRVTNNTSFGADELDAYARIGEFAYNIEDDQIQRLDPAFKASPE